MTFDVKGHRSGVMICYDGDFPEMTRSCANLGCAMLFWMNNRGSRGHAAVKRLADANSMIIATSCCCGVDEAGRRSRGGSNITDATGQLLAELWEAEVHSHSLTRVRERRFVHFLAVAAEYSRSPPPSRRHAPFPPTL